MSISKDRVTGLILSAFSLLYLYFSKDIKVFKGSGATPLTSAFIPRFWGVILLLLGIILVFRKGTGVEGRDTGEAGRTATFIRAWFSKNYEVVLTFVLIGIYLGFLKSVGFIIMSALYIFAQILILTPPGKRRLAPALMTGIIFSPLIDFIFVKLIGVLLPKGILGF